MNVAVENEIYEESAVEVTDDAIDVTVSKIRLMWRRLISQRMRLAMNQSAGRIRIAMPGKAEGVWLLRIQILAHVTARFTRTKTRMSGSSRTRWSGS